MTFFNDLDVDDIFEDLEDDVFEDLFEDSVMLQSAKYKLDITFLDYYLSKYLFQILLRLLILIFSSFMFFNR